MTLTDEEFREEYKPLQVPAHFYAADSQENKMIFALAQIGEGSADDVIAELKKLEGTPVNEQQEILVRAHLENLYNKGLLNGSEGGGIMQYDLSKITEANSGAINPGLLAPGLD